ncbi:MAG: HAMP domain-containing protein [candidate division NC10 bacterium]|nr:HAMP domain-containing protein [candidate division NC10 bacterium]
MSPGHDRPRRSLRLELSLGLAALVSLGILTAGTLLYQRQRHDLQEYLGMSLQNIARTGAVFLDGDAHQRVAATRDKSSPDYRQLRQVLDRVKAENHLGDDVYTLEPVSNTLTRFIVITNESTRVGEEYRLSPETLPLVQRVLREGVSVYSPMYMNEHGRWLTAFAPIRDRQGKVVAVLDVDYRADVFWREVRAIRWRILGFSVAGALVALAAGLWYARRIARPLEGMAVQAREVAQGEFTRRLPVTGAQEVADLAGTLNRMAAQLQAQVDALQRAHLERAHAARLASLGAVAAELAHEMNQPLTAIQGISQGILDQSRDLQAETRQYLQVVVEEARRLGELSQRLREFSRRSRGDLLPVDVNGVVRDACLLLRPTARGRGIHLQEDLARDLPELVADRQGLEQVVLNLLANALDAVEGRPEPRVTLATRLTDGPGDPGVEICIADNGSGIPPEVLPHIFEPFFSTKDAGRGTGLGLPISQDIVERHGGTIRVETEPDAGSRFRVWLPLKPPLGQPDPRLTLQRMEA